MTTTALDWQALAERALHDIKIKVIRTMATGAPEGAPGWSPKALAETIGENLASTSYHVRHLVEYELIHLVATEPRRGALQHYYALKPGVALPGRAPDPRVEEMVEISRRTTGRLAQLVLQVHGSE